MNERYAAPYSSTALMCFMASLECTIIALCVDRDKNAWSLNPIRAISVLYNVSAIFVMSFIFLITTIYYSTHTCFVYIIGNYKLCTSLLFDYMVHQKERTSICLCIPPLAISHFCLSKLGTARREVIRWHVSWNLIKN